MPSGSLLPERMKRYQEVSRQIMNIFDSFSPLVEQLSVDEAFWIFQEWSYWLVLNVISVLK